MAILCFRRLRKHIRRLCHRILPEPRATPERRILACGCAARHAVEHLVFESDRACIALSFSHLRSVASRSLTSAPTFSGGGGARCARSQTRSTSSTVVLACAFLASSV
eukprot:CAMPEP_0118885818 /NCGR_PEP_ID=MMETSP1163-20130328/24133_1 /TAXON_ID=124430 /ORGANISM="Phaeomonas parva, Strain CCMP2877" /LENGTH=107 /DNA_ID=CAMNT_0006823891 /DNA_START=206 /DNA_END=530 /DNA_ORIENTATION=+